MGKLGTVMKRLSTKGRESRYWKGAVELFQELFVTLLITFVLLLLVETIWDESVSPYFNLNYLLIAVMAVGVVAVLAKPQRAQSPDRRHASMTDIIIAMCAGLAGTVIVWYFKLNYRIIVIMAVGLVAALSGPHSAEHQDRRRLSRTEIITVVCAVLTGIAIVWYRTAPTPAASPLADDFVLEQTIHMPNPRWTGIRNLENEKPFGIWGYIRDGAGNGVPDCTVKVTTTDGGWSTISNPSDASGYYDIFLDWGAKAGTWRVVVVADGRELSPVVEVETAGTDRLPGDSGVQTPQIDFRGAEGGEALIGRFLKGMRENAVRGIISIISGGLIVIVSLLVLREGDEEEDGHGN